MLRLVLSLVCIISYPFVPLAHSLDSFRFGCLSVYDKARLIDKGWPKDQGSQIRFTPRIRAS